MASSWDHRAACQSSRRGLQLATQGLQPLAAPVVTPQAASLASATAVMAVSQGALRGVLDALNEGPGSAVADREELYAAGLPMGLPGNLHLVAQHERQELLKWYEDDAEGVRDKLAFD